jgi:hypothetical protein
MGERTIHRRVEAGIDDASDNATAIVKPDRMRELLDGMASNEERATREVDPAEFRALLRNEQRLAEGSDMVSHDNSIVRIDAEPIESPAISEELEVAAPAPRTQRGRTRRPLLYSLLVIEVVAIAAFLGWLVLRANV